MIEMSPSGWVISSYTFRPGPVTQLWSRRCDRNSSEGLQQVLFSADEKTNRNKQFHATSGCISVYLRCLKLCNHHETMKRTSQRISQRTEDVRAERLKNGGPWCNWALISSTLKPPYSEVLTTGLPGNSLPDLLLNLSNSLSHSQLALLLFVAQSIWARYLLNDYQICSSRPAPPFLYSALYCWS